MCCGSYGYEGELILSSRVDFQVYLESADSTDLGQCLTGHSQILNSVGIRKYSLGGINIFMTVYVDPRWS